MRGRKLAVLVGLAGAYVFCSSWFGLTVTPLIEEQSITGAADFFVDVWTDSLLADIVFVAGSLVAGTVAVSAFQRRGWKASIAAGAVTNWFVYLVSYSLLSMQHPDATGVLAATVFVVQWGWPGLIVASVLPGLGVSWLAEGRVRSAVPDTPAG